MEAESGFHPTPLLDRGLTLMLVSLVLVLLRLFTSAGLQEGHSVVRLVKGNLRFFNRTVACPCGPCRARRSIPIWRVRWKRTCPLRRSLAVSFPDEPPRCAKTQSSTRSYAPWRKRAPQPRRNALQTHRHPRELRLRPWPKRTLQRSVQPSHAQRPQSHGQLPIQPHELMSRRFERCRPSPES